MLDTFYEALQRKLHSIHPDACYQLANIETMPLFASVEVLKVLLRWSCQSQHLGNISAARQMLTEIPSAFLLRNLSAAIDSELDLEDEWQYRRLLEVLRLVVPQLLQKYVDFGGMSVHSDVREAAEDFAWLVHADADWRFLFQVSGYMTFDEGVGLQPGIPQALIRASEVGKIRQGSNLWIRQPGGKRIMTAMKTFTVQVPTGCDEYSQARTLPLIPVVGSDAISEIPVGSEVYVKLSE